MVHRLEANFSANLINTVSFIVNLFIQCSTAVVNYVGASFVVPLRSNTQLSSALAISYATALCLVSQAIPSLNALFELAPMPNAIALKIAAMGAADLVACSIFERVLGACLCYAFQSCRGINSCKIVVKN